MDERDANGSRERWATGLRTATLVVVLGTLAAIWHPHNAGMTAGATDAAPAAAAPVPDMSVYFPDRFPAPTGNADEPQPPTF